MILRGANCPEFLRTEVLADVFEATALAYPQKTALVYGEQRLSYAELDARSSLAAHHLLAQGAGPGSIVGLFLPRGVELLVAQLAIAKTGAAWLPFDADTPVERIAVCLEDATAVGLVSGACFTQQLSGLSCPVWDEAVLQAPVSGALQRRVGCRPEDPAYVIYTSGSTGKPKGVPITQGAICHFLRSENAVLGVRADDVVYQGFSVAFDMSFEEIWISYLVGASLWIAPRALTADPDALPIALRDNGITVLHAVPTLLALFAHDVPGLRLINLGGEMCPQSVADRWAKPGRQVFNTYGPTEATVSASLAELQAGAPITIGKPLPNYGLLVLGEQQQLLPQGEMGELCIIGPGVAEGYLGRPELTAEKFIPNAWAESLHEPRLYRTGDLARIDEAGQIHCLGRVDDQVKVRGFRVELGEIEATLAKQATVGSVAVVLKSVQEIDQLVAYIVPSDDAPLDVVGLRQALRAQLPPYMVPSHFIALPAFERLTSGKIDRKVLRALPMPEMAAETHLQAQTPAEEALFEVLQRLFPGQVLARDADFFDDLGGHSLLAARVVSALRQDTRFARVTINDVYANRRLAEIAQAMQQQMVAESFVLPPFKIAPRWRRYACGLAQTVALPCVICLRIFNWLAPFFTYHLYTGEPNDSIAFAIFASMLAFIVMHAANLLIAVLASRVLLCKLPAGRYSLWGVAHFRWWLADRLQHTAPVWLLTGSWLYNDYLRALGAKIGRDVVVGSITIRQPHLLHVDDGASIGSTVHIENVRVERGELVVGAVAVGKEAYIGSYSVVEGDSGIAAYGRLEGLSSLLRGRRIGVEEVWEGSPASLKSTLPAALRPKRQAVSKRRLCGERLFFVVGAIVTLLIFFLPLFPGFMLIDFLDDSWATTPIEDGGYLYAVLCYALLAIPASALLVLFTALLAAAIRWSVLPRLSAASWPIHSAMYCRKWLANLIQVASLQVLHGVYATVYAPWWYRLLGAKVGRRTEISTAMGVVPDMLTLGDDAFIADAVMLGDEEVDSGWMSFDYTVVGSRTFIGNGAYVPDGTTLPNDVLIGVQSRAPISEAMQPGQTWVGSPPVHLPARETLTGFPDALTFYPSLWRVVARSLVEAARIVMPLALVIGVGYVIVLASIPYAAAEDWWGLALHLSLSGMYYGLGCFVFVALLKWLLIGRYSPCSAPMWTFFVWVSEAITSLYEAIAVPNFLECLRGTPMLPWALRLMGAKIGTGVYLDTTDITEFDCVAIGAYSELNAFSGPQTHLFEDRVMKIGRVDIGRCVTVGVRGTVLYNSKIEDEVLVGPLSLIMKGEQLPTKTAWSGSPTQPWRN